MTGVEANWNPTLEAEFKDEVGSIPISGRSLLIERWIVWPLVFQQKESTKDLTTNQYRLQATD